MSIAMDITPSSLRSHDATCAFPSWPRRSSLGESDSDDSSYSRPTAFLSDDDLFFCTSNVSADPFDESAASSSSSASSARSSLEMEREMDLQQRERERAQREQFLRQAILDKERERRRHQQAMMRRAQMGGQRKASPSKKSSSSQKNNKLTSIAETKE